MSREDYINKVIDHEIVRLFKDDDGSYAFEYNYQEERFILERLRLKTILKKELNGFEMTLWQDLKEQYEYQNQKNQ